MKNFMQFLFINFFYEKLEQNLEDPDALANKDAYDEAVQRLKVLQDQHQRNIDDISRIEEEINAKRNKIAKKERNINILSKFIVVFRLANRL